MTSEYDALRTRAADDYLYELRVSLYRAPPRDSQPAYLSRRLEPFESAAEALVTLGQPRGGRPPFAGAFCYLDRSRRYYVVDLVYAPSAAESVEPVSTPASTLEIPPPAMLWMIDAVNQTGGPVVHYVNWEPVSGVQPHFAAARRKVGTDWMPGVAAGALAVNAYGEVLLQRRRDNGKWGLPGGGVEIGERIEDAVCREVREETGYEVRCGRLLVVRSGRDCTITYPDGNKCWYLGFLYLVEICGGQPQHETEETTGLAWFRPGNPPAPIGEYDGWCVRKAAHLPETLIVD